MSLNDLDVKIRILQVDGDKPVSLLDLRHDSPHRQHLELPFVEGKIQTVPLWNEEVAAEETLFDFRLWYFLYCSFLQEGGKFLL